MCGCGRPHLRHVRPGAHVQASADLRSGCRCRLQKAGPSPVAGSFAHWERVFQSPCGVGGSWLCDLETMHRQTLRSRGPHPMHVARARSTVPSPRSQTGQRLRVRGPGRPQHRLRRHTAPDDGKDSPSHLRAVRVLTSSEWPLSGEGGAPSTATGSSEGSAAGQAWPGSAAEFAHGSPTPGTEFAHGSSALAAGFARGSSRPLRYAWMERGHAQ